MFLNRLIVSDFKNIASADLTFSPGINCICGDNGQGKTNLLDAVNYLSVTKSFLSSTDRYAIRYNTSKATLHGRYQVDNDQVEIALSINDGGEKELRIDSKTCRKISDYIGKIPVVVVSPSDSSLINDSAQARRRFINIMLSQTDPDYLTAAVSYNKLLKQRNKLLKQPGVHPMLLDSFTEMMAPLADYICEKRGEAVRKLSAGTALFYKEISGNREEVSIEYDSDLLGCRAEKLFGESINKDMALGFTSVGVQRDEIQFLMGGKPVRMCASQGQQKSFIIAAKMAQYKIMNELFKASPLLLLDDLFDKLDIHRINFLVDMVLKDNFGQVFITDTDRTRIEDIVSKYTSESMFYGVKDGVFERI